MDSHTIDNIINGDQEAFRELVEKYKIMVYSLCCKILQNNEDAEEVSQDVFVKVYLSIKSYRKESKLSTWIYSIAYNTAISKSRKKKYQKELITDKNYTAFDISEIEEKEQINKALKQLYPNERGIIMMYYFEEFSVKEIAEISSLSVSNVKITLHRTRLKLKAILESTVKKELQWMI